MPVQAFFSAPPSLVQLLTMAALVQHVAAQAFDNSSSMNATTTTSTAPPPLITGFPFTMQQGICRTLSPLMGLWYTGYLIVSTGVLANTVRQFAKQGAMFAMPRLAGLRYNLLAALWVQGLMHVLQAFRDDGGDGCYVTERFILVDTIPMPAGQDRAAQLARAATDAAVFFDEVISGYIVMMLLIAMPRMRLNFVPDGQPEPEGFCCIPGWLCRRCGVLVICLLIFVNPIVVVLTVRVDLFMCLCIELLVFVTGMFLAWLVARGERAALAGLFEHIYLQEWSCLSAAVLTRLGRILVSATFHYDTAAFINAFITTFSLFGVLLHLVCCTPPVRDPLLWLAGQDWCIRASLEPERDKAKHKRQLRRTVVRFVISMFNFRHVIQLVAEGEFRQFLNWDIRLKEPDHEDEVNELVLGRLAWIEWDRWAEKVCSSWPGLKELYPVLVKNISRETRVKDLEAHFKSCGHVLHCRLLENQEDDKRAENEEVDERVSHIGSVDIKKVPFARVDFATKEEQDKAAAELDGTTLKGCVISVSPHHFKDNCSSDISNVESPTSLTPGEKRLASAGSLTRRSLWMLVQGDTFSDRVHNQDIAVLVLCIVCTTPITLEILTGGIPFFPDMDPSLMLLLQSLVFCLLVWLFQSVLLFGNNVFMPLILPGHWGRRVWLILVVLFALYSLVGDTMTIAVLAGPEVDMSAPFRSFSVFFTLFHVIFDSALLSISLRLLVVDRMPQVRNTYHRLEFAAQRYCQKLLEGDARIAKVKDGQAYQLRWGNSYRPCLVKSAHMNGTCTVVLQGGQEVENVVTKDMQALHPEARLGKQDRDALQALKDAMAPVVKSIMNGADMIFGAVRFASNIKEQSVESIVPGKSGRNGAAAKAPEAGGEEPAAAGPGGRIGELLAKLRSGVDLQGAASVADVKLEERAAEGGEEPAPGGVAVDVDEARRRGLQVSEEKMCLLECACLEGRKRQMQIDRQREQALGYRAYFNASVGLSGLFLTAVIIGPMLVFLLCAFLGAKTMEVERGLSRMHSGSAYALRVQTMTFAYGACAPPTEEERRACKGSIGEAPCDRAEPLLLWAFDEDGSHLLEPKELEFMSRSLASMSVAAAVGGVEASALSATEFRDITRWAAHPGTDFLDEQGLEAFVCGVAQTVASRSQQNAAALKAIGTMENVSAAIVFPLADNNPQDGYVTERELLDLLPAGNLGHLAPVGAALQYYSIAVRIGFLVGDVNPTDGRLSMQESDMSIATVARLMKSLPRLAAEIDAVLSGQKATFDPSVVIDVVDLDGDGAVSRLEASIMGIILESATGNPNIAGQVLQAFDSADGDKDGIIMAADLAQMLTRLQNTLALLGSLASKDPQVLAQTLVAVLDRDQDGALSRSEFDNLVMFLPPQYASQAPFVLNLVFSQADTAPKDGKLDGPEVQIAAQRVQALLQQFSEAANNPGQQQAAMSQFGPGPSLPGAPGAPGQGRSLAAVRGGAPGRRTSSAGIEVSGETVDAMVQLLGFSASTIFDGHQPLLHDHIKKMLWVFNSDEFRIIAPLVVMSMRISILGAVFSASWMMLRTTIEHERLTQHIQMGGKNYVGAMQRKLLRNSFSVSTSFPGMFIATVVINFLVALLMIFTVLVITVTPIVLFIIPGTRPLMLRVLLLLRFPIFAALVKWFLKGVVDRLLVEHGQPVYPQFFAPLWLTLILLNFVQAPFFAVFRWGTLLVVASLKSTYMHSCAVSEALMSFDPGYYAFVALTFTQSARRNLARAVTLWNNPELRQSRRISKEREFSSLITMWDERTSPEEEERRRRRAEAQSWFAVAEARRAAGKLEDAMEACSKMLSVFKDSVAANTQHSL